MAFPPSILLHPSFSSPRTILGGCCSGSRRSGGGCIRRRPMLLTLSLSRARTGAVTQPRRVGSGSGRQRRDHPGLKPTQARWSRTSRAGPAAGQVRSCRLFWIAAGASHVLTPSPTSLTLLPEEITAHAHCQTKL